MAAIIWLIVGVALAVAEVFSLDFVLVMFALGAFGAAGSAAFGAPLVIQAFVFAAVSTLSLGAVRPWARRHLLRGGHPVRMGIEALEGASATVLEKVDTENGTVKIEGETWTARAYDATQVIEPGERVQVVEIRGATALVWRQS